MEKLSYINIQEPQCTKLANLLKGIAIFMKYDCTGSLNIETETFYVPTYIISFSADSKDFDSKDLKDLEKLGWRKGNSYVSWREEWYYD